MPDFTQLYGLDPDRINALLISALTSLDKEIKHYESLFLSYEILSVEACEDLRAYEEKLQTLTSQNESFRQRISHLDAENNRLAILECELYNSINDSLLSISRATLLFHYVYYNDTQKKIDSACKQIIDNQQEKSSLTERISSNQTSINYFTQQLQMLRELKLSREKESKHKRQSSLKLEKINTETVLIRTDFCLLQKLFNNFISKDLESSQEKAQKMQEMAAKIREEVAAVIQDIASLSGTKVS